MFLFGFLASTPLEAILPCISCRTTASQIAMGIAVNGNALNLGFLGEHNDCEVVLVYKGVT